MYTPEDIETTRLRALVGGTLVASNHGRTDHIDALEGLIGRTNHTALAILTGVISQEGINVLHERDKEAVSRELSNKKRS